MRRGLLVSQSHTGPPPNTYDLHKMIFNWFCGRVQWKFHTQSIHPSQRFNSRRINRVFSFLLRQIGILYSSSVKKWQGVIFARYTIQYNKKIRVLKTTTRRKVQLPCLCFGDLSIESYSHPKDTKFLPIKIYYISLRCTQKCESAQQEKCWSFFFFLFLL